MFSSIIITGILSSIISGVMGTLIDLKQINQIIGGLAHTCLGGIGIAYFLGIDEYFGALVFAIISALIISFVHFNKSEKENTIINILWSLGMSLGVLFMYLKPGYGINLSSFLFGNIVLISKTDLIFISVLFLIISILILIYYKQFLLMIIDEDQVKLKNISLKFLYTLFLILTALTIVILVRITGLVLLLAFLVIPVNIIKTWTKKIYQIMFLSGVLNILVFLLSFFIAYSYDLPIGVLIVITLSLIYFFNLGVLYCFRKS
jgi:zinc transport system permease protein